MRNTIRLNERQLRSIVKESVEKVLGGGIVCCAVISSNQMDKRFYNSNSSRMSEDEYLRNYHLGEGDDSTVIRNLLKYAKRSGEARNEPWDTDDYNNLVSNSYAEFGDGMYTAVVDDDDYNPTIYIFRR